MSERDEAAAELARAVQRQAHRVLLALVEHQTTEEDPDHALDPTFSIDALLSVVAAILETGPAFESKRDLRIATDDAADRLKAYVREMRAHFERTGRHGLEMIGGTPYDPTAEPARAH